MNQEEVDVLIIGAGPSGVMAASIVNKNGFKVKIVEKTKFPRYVIGESLLARSMEHFEEAGVLDVLKEQQFQKKHGAIFLKGNQKCEFDFSEQFTKGCRESVHVRTRDSTAIMECSDTFWQFLSLQRL